MNIFLGTKFQLITTSFCYFFHLFELGVDCIYVFKLFYSINYSLKCFTLSFALYFLSDCIVHIHSNALFFLLLLLSMGVFSFQHFFGDGEEDVYFHGNHVILIFILLYFVSLSRPPVHFDVIQVVCFCLSS